MYGDIAMHVVVWYVIHSFIYFVIICLCICAFLSCCCGWVCLLLLFTWERSSGGNSLLIGNILFPSFLPVSCRLSQLVWTCIADCTCMNINYSDWFCGFRILLHICVCVCLFVCYKILDFYSDISFNAVGLFLLSLCVCG